MNVEYEKKHYANGCLVEIVDGEFKVLERGEKKGDKPCYVDVKGYLPLAKQVERHIAAGLRLEAFRKGYYDSENIDDDSEPSPFSNPDLLGSDVPNVIGDYQAKLTRRLEASRSPQDLHNEANVAGDEQKVAEVVRDTVRDIEG